MEFSGILDRVRGKAPAKEQQQSKWEHVLGEQLKAAEKRHVAARFFEVGDDDVVSITVERRIDGKTLIFFDSITKHHPRKNDSDVVVLNNGVPSMYNLKSGVPKPYEDQANANGIALSRFEGAHPYEGKIEWGGKVRDLAQVTRIAQEIQFQVPDQSSEVEQMI